MNLFHRRPDPVPAGVTGGTATAAAADGTVAAAPAATTGRRSVRRQGLLSRIGGTLLTVVMALALIVFVAMTVLRISGGELLAIRTGSMTPMMKPGDLLISREVDPRTVRRGDVITFRVPEADNTLVTHRVTKVDEKGNTFTTKGDANDTVDPFTTKAKDVLGTRWFSIPAVGRIMVFLSTGLGTALLIGIPAAIYLGQTLADRRALRRAATAPAVADVPMAVTADVTDEVAAQGPGPSAATSTTSTTSPPTTPTTPPPGPEIGAPHAGPHPGAPPWGTPPWSAPSWGAPPWGAPPWGTQVHHAVAAPPPQVIVVQLPPTQPTVPTPPPFQAPPPSNTPPPFRRTAVPTAAPGTAPGPTPVAVPAHELPPDLAAELGAEWVLICPVEPSVAAHLRHRTRKD